MRAYIIVFGNANAKKRHAKYLIGIPKKGTALNKNP
jgi:hypothetical protein